LPTHIYTLPIHGIHSDNEILKVYNIWTEVWFGKQLLLSHSASSSQRPHYKTNLKRKKKKKKTQYIRPELFCWYVLILM